METSQGTNHDDTSTETLCGKSGETGLRGDGTEGLALVFLLAHQGDQRVSGVRDDGADDTREVTGSEGDSELSGLAVGVLRSSEDVGIEEFDNLLEEAELGHGIWDLCPIMPEISKSVKMTYGSGLPDETRGERENRRGTWFR